MRLSSPPGLPLRSRRRATSPRWLPCALTLLLAAPAWAQRVVVLEIDGDSGHRLRAQIESVVRKAGQLEVLSLSAYKDAAARRKMKGAAAMTPVGVARANKLLPLDAAVGGEARGKSFKVVIWDRAGQQLWEREIPLKGGLLTEELAVKLSRAILAAAEQGAARPTDAGAGGAEPDTDPDLGGTGTDGRRVVEPAPDPERDTDLDTEGKKKKKASGWIGPPLIRVLVGGTTTWRYQCLRPGVASCREYDFASRKPDGIVIDFTASVPYLGLSLSGELFPLARFDNRILQGFGVVTSFGYGASITRIQEETPQGAGAEKLVTSTDVGWTLQAAWRYHFGVGYGEPTPTGYAGLRGGLLARSFTIDPDAATSLPSSQRTYPTGLGFPVVGLDASVPISKYFRLELAVSLFFNPRPSPEQIIGYGNLSDPTGGAASTGWHFEGGFAGDIWTTNAVTFGWRAHLQLMSFADRYYGQGQKWTVCNEQQCGGAAEEMYTSIHWGVTASY